MKKILVPTDFSPIADDALKYAIEIAAEFKCEIILYHAYYIHKVEYNLNFSEDDQPFKRQVERKMELTKQRFIQTATQKEISLQTIVEHDLVYGLFKSKAKNFGADLIVMGSKGASGLEKVIFGTVAAAALELSEIPVLIVPPRYNFVPPQHIVLALDRSEISEEVCAPVQKLASKFGAEVIGLHVNTRITKRDQHKIDLYLKDIPVTYREVSTSGSINEAIDEFTRKDHCDLLSMVRRKKSFFQSLFQKSITKTQAYQNSVPLLILPEQ